jgi:hypothetical protein
MRTSRPDDTHRPHARRWLGSVVVALFLAVLFAAPASAATAAEVAAALTRDPVYVDPAAEVAISHQKVVDQVRRAGTPIYIAVLPTSARDEYGGDPRELAEAIANMVNRKGSYMVVSGRHFEAGNAGRTIPSGQASALAEQAANDHPNDPEAAMLQWVNQVAAAA